MPTIGHVTATWSARDADPAVWSKPGAEASTWHHGYDLGIYVDDNTTISVDRRSAVAVLIEDPPAVVKIGSAAERSTVNLKRVVVNGRTQMFCRLFSGSIEVYLAGPGNPADSPLKARVVVQAVSDPVAVNAANAGTSAKLVRAAPGGTSAGAGNGHPMFLADIPLPQPITIGAGGTVFVVSWGDDHSTVYCACDHDSVVAVQRGDQLLKRVGSDQEMIVPTQADDRHVPEPGPRTERYDQVLATIQEVTRSAPRTAAEVVQARRDYELSLQATQRVIGIGGGLTALGSRLPDGRLGPTAIVSSP